MLSLWEFPYGLVVKTPWSHCPGPEFQSLVGELRSHKLYNVAKTNKSNNKKQKPVVSLKFKMLVT